MISKNELNKRYYSTGEVAKLLGVVPMTIMRWDKKGKIKFSRTDTNRRVISREDLIDFLKEDSLVMIDSDTSTLYALGALISKLIFEKKGLDGWKIFLNVPEEDVEKVIIELLGIEKNKLNIYLLEELKKYE